MGGNRDDELVGDDDDSSLDEAFKIRSFWEIFRRETCLSLVPLTTALGVVALVIFNSFALVRVGETVLTETIVRSMISQFDSFVTDIHSCSQRLFLQPVPNFPTVNSSAGYTADFNDSLVLFSQAAHSWFYCARDAEFIGILGSDVLVFIPSETTVGLVQSTFTSSVFLVDVLTREIIISSDLSPFLNVYSSWHDNDQSLLDASERASSPDSQQSLCSDDSHVAFEMRVICFPEPVHRLWAGQSSFLVIEQKLRDISISSYNGALAAVVKEDTSLVAGAGVVPVSNISLFDASSEFFEQNVAIAEALSDTPFSILDQPLLESLLEAPGAINSLGSSFPRSTMYARKIPVAPDFIVVARATSNEAVPEQATFLLNLTLGVAVLLLTLLVGRAAISCITIRMDLRRNRTREDFFDRRRQKALRDAEDERARSAAKTRFLSVMSHELRNPLTGVVLNSDLLLATALDEDQRDHCEGIGRAAQVVLAIVNDVLDLSKIESGRLQLEKVNVSLRDAIEFVAQSCGPSAHSKGLELVVDIEHGINVHCLGDPVRLRQIIHNLVSNAIKFTKSGRVEVHLRRVSASSLTKEKARARGKKKEKRRRGGLGKLSSGASSSDSNASSSANTGGANSPVRAAGSPTKSTEQSMDNSWSGTPATRSRSNSKTMGALNALIAPSPTELDTDASQCYSIEVVDTGIGISPEGLTRLFKEFSQVNSSTTREYGGTGLGLYISKQLTTMMGGVISVTSSEGVGTTFRVDLPLTQLTGAGASSSSSSAVSPVPPIDALVSQNSSGNRWARLTSTDVTWRALLLVADDRLRSVVVTHVRHTLECAGDAQILPFGPDQTSEFIASIDDNAGENGDKKVLTLAIVDQRLLPSSDEGEAQAGTSGSLVDRVFAAAQLGTVVPLLLSMDSGAADRKELEKAGWQSLIFRPVRLGQLSQAVADSVRNSSLAKGSVFEGAMSRRERLKKRSASPRSGSRRSSGSSDDESATQVGSITAPRVLIVDDFELMRSLVATALTTLGYRSHTASNGQEAVDAVIHAFEQENDPYDCILMDCEMPVVNGFEATRRIRALELDKATPRTRSQPKTLRSRPHQLKHTPIIAMTANALREDQAKCMESGMTAFMAKPVSRDTLLSMLQKHIVIRKGSAKREKVTPKMPTTLEASASSKKTKTKSSLPKAKSSRRRVKKSPRGGPKIAAGMKALVVDDQDIIRKVLVTALESCGAVVVQGGNGDEALQLVKENDDLSFVLLDIELGEDSGLDVLKQIRELRGDKLFVAASTGNVAADDRASYIEAGFNGILEKPVTRADLVSLIENLRKFEE